MREERIREQTQTILDAYRILTGSDRIPSIGEFLQIREAAVRETETAGEMPAAVQNSPQRRRQETVKETTVTVPVKAPPAAAPEMREKIPAVEEAKSDFDILRQIKDPWN